MYTHDSETYLQAEKTIEFAGGTENAPGDHDGTGDPIALFTVTGTVFAKVIGICTETLTIDAGATLEVGTALNTAGLIAQTAGDAIDINELWHDATPDSSVEATTVMAEKIVNQNIIATVATNNITNGTIKFVCLWRPLTPNATVV